MLWLALIDPTWYVGANILNIVGNVTYGAAYVFNAGYLPKLARNHPDVLNATTEQEREEKLVFRTSRISIFGSAFGFFGGFVQMIIGVGKQITLSQERCSSLLEFDRSAFSRNLACNESNTFQRETRYFRWRCMVGSFRICTNDSPQATTWTSFA
jgi:hypothetical protein